MKKLLAISILAITLSINAQYTNGVYTTNVLGQNISIPAPPQTTSVGDDFLKFLRDAIDQPEMLYEFHGLYAKGLPKHYGGGLGAFYPVTPYLFTGLRLDYVNGGFWMPSGNVGLQLPIYPLSFLGGSWTNVSTTFFGYGGIAAPISGAKIGNITIPGAVPKDNNGELTGIVGIGVAVKIYGSSSGFLTRKPIQDKWWIDCIGDVEKWTGFDGNQYRLAIAFHKKTR